MSHPYDEACDYILGRLEAADAVSWVLDQSQGPRVLGELDIKESESLIRELDAYGAINLRVLGESETIETYGSADFLILELPDEPEQRKALLEIERTVHEPAGFDGSVDEGQVYLLIRCK